MTQDTSLPLRVHRTRLQKVVGIVAGAVCLLIGLFFTWMILWAAPHVVAIPRDADAATHLLLFVLGGPGMTLMGGLVVLMVSRLPAQATLMEVTEDGVRLMVDARQNRHDPPISLHWRDVAWIRAMSGSRGAGDLTFGMRDGQQYKAMAAFTEPPRNQIAATAAAAAGSAGFDVQKSWRWYGIATAVTWRLSPR